MADRTSTVRVNVDANTKGAVSGFRSLGGIAKTAALGVGALVLGVGLGATKLYDYADAADDANARIENITSSMGLFEGQAGKVAARVEDVAKQTALSTATDINSIKAAQAKLLTFKELAKSADTAGGAFDRATAATIDMAAAGFGTAETNAVQLGKALNDPIKGITALTRSGITFTEAEKAKIAAMVESGHVMNAQSFILSAIEKQVGGTAEATAGGFEKMKAAVSIFGQELAVRALPYMDRFGNYMINKGGPALLAFGHAAETKALPPLRSFASFVQSRVLPVLSSAAAFVTDHVVPAYGKVLGGVMEGARGFIKNVSDAIGDNKSELGDLGDAAKKAATFFVDHVIPVMGELYKHELPALGFALGVAIRFVADLVAGFESVYNKVQSAIGAIESFKDKLSNLPGAGALGALVHAAGGRAAADVAGIPGIPFSHTPTAGRTSASPTGDLHVHVHLDDGFQGFIGDPVTLARALRDLLRDDQIRLAGVTG